MILFALSKYFSNKDSVLGYDAEIGEDTKKVSLMIDCFANSAETTEAFENYFYTDTGVELEIINLPENNWEAFLMSKITSSGTADVIKCPNNILPLVEEGQIISLDSYIKNDEEMMKIYEAVPEAFDTYAIDGEIYAIGNTRPYSMVLWVRKDWLDKLEIDMPTSMDDLTDMFYALKEMTDADGKEITSLVLVGNLRSLNIFASAYGLRNEVFLKDGVYVEPFFEPEFESYATYIKGLYDGGIMDASFSTVKSYSSVRNSFGAENGATIVMWSNIYHTLSRLLDESGCNDYQLVIVPAFETEYGVFGIAPSATKEPFAITAEAENPEFVFNTLIKWIYTDIDGIMATSIGIPGYNFQIEDGKMVDLNNIGHRGQGFPALYPDVEYPFELHNIVQERMDFVLETEELCDEYSEVVPLSLPSYEYKDYWNIYWRISDKREELFFKYIEDKLTYDEMIDEYKVFYEEYDLENILKEMNQ